jgi:ribonuclease P protein component
VPPGRLRDRASFEALRRSGRRVRRGPITVTYSDVGPCKVPRVAYAVGRRAGGAVQRNRAKRRLRAIVRELMQQLPPGDYLVAAAPGAMTLNYPELRDLVRDCVAELTGEPI